MEIPGYTIIKELGRGGMATVYLAVQQSLDRNVALKIMSPALLADESFGSRFLREAKIVAKLSHPNVIPIYDVGTHKEYYYIAMEYESGGELKQRIKNGLSLQEAVSITVQIASALQFAHSNGYIHRDVKPDNILFTAHDKALLTDFGVARAYDSSTKITAVGAVLGTPLYMSPEQVQGKSIDHRADLYSLGTVFYEMLMGYPPYRGDSAVTVAVKHMTDPVPLLPEKFAKLQPLIDKLLNKDADQRFQSGAEIISELERIDLNNVAVSLTGALVGDLTGDKAVDKNSNNTVAKSAAATDNAVDITDEDHDAPTVVRSEPLAKAVDPPQATKSTIPIVLMSSALMGVLIVVGVLYFARQQPQQISIAQNSIAQNSPVSAPQAESTEEPPQPTNKHSAPALDDKRQHIAELISLAKQDVAENRFTRPAGNNAYEKYLDVLRLDAGNSDADAGLRVMSEHFLGQIDPLLQEKQFEQAADLYDQAQRVYPKNPDLEKYQTSLQQAVAQYEEQQKQLAAEQKRRSEELKKQRQQAEQKRLAREKQKQQELAALKAQQQEQAKQAALEKQKQEQQELQRQQEQLQQEQLQQEKGRHEQQTKITLMAETATTLLTQNNLSVSAIDQAYKIYNNDIRAIDPESPAIKTGVAAVVSAYGTLAQKELDNKKYDNAEAIVQKGLAIDGRNTGLLKIQQTIKRSKSKAPSVFGGF